MLPGHVGKGLGDLFRRWSKQGEQALFRCPLPPIFAKCCPLISAFTRPSSSSGFSFVLATIRFGAVMLLPYFVHMKAWVIGCHWPVRCYCLASVGLLLAAWVWLATMGWAGPPIQFWPVCASGNQSSHCLGTTIRGLQRLVTRGWANKMGWGWGSRSQGWAKAGSVSWAPSAVMGCQVAGAAWGTGPQHIAGIRPAAGWQAAGLLLSALSP